MSGSEQSPAPGNRDTPPESPPVIPGHQLLRQIARGSYGEIWLARTELGAFRAVKIIRRANFSNPKPFDREFGGIQRYEPISREHEALVDVLQVGRDEAAGFFYYVMELADGAQPPGEDRRSKMEGGHNAQAGSRHPQSSILDPRRYVPLTLAHAIKQRQRLPVDEVVALGISLTRALEFLHARRLVHRDIKPTNIIFVGGQPKLADVGLIADLGGPLTFVGTEGYIPPEGPGSAQADIYSLGKVLYEAATGKDRQEFPDLAMRINEAPDKALLELNEVLLKACESNPRARYSTAVAMAADLERIKAGRSLRDRRKRGERFRAIAVGSTVMAAMALLAVGLAAFVQYERSKPRLLFHDDFDGARPDTLLWTWSHADGGGPEAGPRTFSVEQSGGELVLRATADHTNGVSTAESVWLDLKSDFRKAGPSRLDIELSGTAREGSLTVAISTGSAPANDSEVGGIKLAGIEKTPGLSSAWPAATIRIDLLPQSQSAIVYANTNDSNDFDVVDLRSLPTWHLRFHCSAATARGLAGGLVEMRIKRVSCNSNPQADALVGRVIELPSLWPVQDAVIKDASGKTLAKSLANGAFVANYEPKAGPFTVEKAGYELLGSQSPGASIGRTFVMAELRKLKPSFGDVVEVISSREAATFGAASLGFRGDTLNLLAQDTATECRLLPVDTAKRDIVFTSPDVLKRNFEMSIGPLAFANCGERLIGIAHWPGKILNLATNPLQALTELKHSDGTRLNWPRGCAFDGQWLWFVEMDVANERFGLHALDLDRMVITNSVKSIDRSIWGLAWDGKQFWVSRLQGGGGYIVDREAALRHGTVEMAKGREFKGHYDSLAFGQDHLWGLEVATRRICKIRVTD